MTFAIREVERTASRVLAAVRFIDGASRLPVTAPLRIVAPAGTALLRNRSGLYVVHRQAALSAHTGAFADIPGDPEAGSVRLRLEVHDPAGIYLPRAFTLALPRDPDPANAADEDSLFRPVTVELFPSPAAPLEANWAEVRVTLAETASRDALGGALLTVTAGGRTLARGLTDWRGEALVAVPGVPVTTWSEDEDAVLVDEIGATLEVRFSATAGGVRTPAALVRTGALPAAQPVADPEALESDAGALRLSAPVALSAGRRRAVALDFALPG